MNFEHWRPTWHLTPPTGWMNDPNGLIQHRGHFHAFYQSNPAEDRWGDIAWAHAVSTDLHVWRHLPPALEPFPGATPGNTTLIFSGSAVCDRDSEGRLTGRLRAYFTAHERCGDIVVEEALGLAWSDDDGLTWLDDERSPLLRQGTTDWRDPKVFWFERHRCWIMVIAEPRRQCVQIHRSPDGIEWKQVSEFVRPSDDGRLWECPDLVELCIDGTDERRWVLIISTSHRHGLPFTGMEYWVGDFDGHSFSSDTGAGAPVDFGKDCFAGVTFNETASNEAAIFLAWASDWAYAAEIPPTGWKGAMTSPRHLALAARNGRLILRQILIMPLDAMTEIPSDQATGLTSAVLRGAATENATTVRLLSEAGDFVDIVIDPRAREIWIDRRHQSPQVPEMMRTIDRVSLAADSHLDDLTIAVDGCVLELVALDGTLVMTELFFLSTPWGVEIEDGDSGRNWKILR